jgi:hypothetical protein
MKIKYISLALAILSLLTAQTSQALPVIDGIVEAGEYANTSSQSYKLDGNASDNGSVDLYWQTVSGDLYVGFVLDNRLVDNCYGTSALSQCGYIEGHSDPFHPLGDLTGSDKALISIGTLDFTMDYLIKDSWDDTDGKAKAGLGGEGSGGSLLDMAQSSMTYNINNNPTWSQDTSPALLANWDGTTGPGGYDITGNSQGITDWDFLVTYEFKILEASLTGIDTSFINIKEIHISDSKLGGDDGHKLTPCIVNDDCPPPSSVPEPSAFVLLALGLFGLGIITTRRKRIL